MHAKQTLHCPNYAWRETAAEFKSPPWTFLLTSCSSPPPAAFCFLHLVCLSSPAVYHSMLPRSRPFLCRHALEQPTRQQRATCSSSSGSCSPCVGDFFFWVPPYKQRCIARMWMDYNVSSRETYCYYQFLRGGVRAVDEDEKEARAVKLDQV